ncbi:MAG: DUF5693 family protein [Halothermotrichaceae bacterium]
MSRKKIFLIILAISLLFSFYSLWGRYKTESNNNGVELIMDYKALSNLEDKEIMLDRLVDSGLSAVAIYPSTIDDLIENGLIKRYTGNDINKMKKLTGNIAPEFEKYDYNDQSAFLIINNTLREKMEGVLPEWSDEYGFRYYNNNELNLIFIKEWKDKYLNLSYGFDNDSIRLIWSKDLKVIPRPGNNQLNKDLIMTRLEQLSPDYIIFQGDEVTGYDDDIQKTAELMKDEDIVFGMIERFIANQKGADRLAYLTDLNLLRVHSIQQKEMDRRENYTIGKIVDRYLRAVRERNVRLLYLKPFLEEKNNKTPETLTIDFVNRLSSQLKSQGYKIGTQDLYPDFSNSTLVLFFISLGIFTAGIYLLEILSGTRLNKDGWILIFTGLVLEVILLLTGREYMLRKILALGSSIIFPSLAVITQLIMPGKASILLKFLKAVAISMLGVFFLTASLADISFIVKVNQFTGVKLSFVMPILIISFYYFKSVNITESENWFKQISTILDKNIKIKHLLLLFMLGIGGLVYIGRTGNNPVIPIPDIEVILRTYLEKFLYIRPRFKEFLIGHPFFILGAGLYNKIKNKLYLYPVIILASIGQINIINTFSHIHTPFIISIIRVIHGFWLGLLVGIVFYIIARMVLQFVQRKKEEYSG